MNHLIRNAEPKPAKGSLAMERRVRMAKVSSHELAEKRKVRLRDRVCRWPFCSCKKWKLRLEVAHVVSKSLGGSNDADNLILLCVSRHQGRPSLHSGDLKIEPQTSAGTNGPVDFFSRDESGRWQVIASEKSIGISVAVGA